jgi:hypothetical protein
VFTGSKAIGEQLPRLRACLAWLVKTTLYAWIAPWALLAAYVTLFRPSAQMIREFFVNVATAESSDWAHVSDMLIAISFVIGGGVFAFRFPNSPIWQLIEENILEPIAKWAQESWERRSLRTRASLKYSTAALVLTAVLVFGIVLHGRQSKGLLAISKPPLLAPPPIPRAAAAIVLSDGSLLSGTAEVGRQAASTYIVRFQQQRKDSHE